MVASTALTIGQLDWHSTVLELRGCSVEVLVCPRVHLSITVAGIAAVAAVAEREEFAEHRERETSRSENLGGETSGSEHLGEETSRLAN